MVNDVINSEGWASGLLCCAADKIGFYQKCGWVLSDREFVRDDDPDQRYFRDVNVLTFGLKRTLPPVVHLTGRPF